MQEEKENKTQGSMDAIDIDEYKKMLNSREQDPNEPPPLDMGKIKRAAKKEDDVQMDSIVDIDSYKQEISSDFNEKKAMEDITPIEVKSTRHIELQKEAEKKAEQRIENVKSAHTAAGEIFDWLESILMAVLIIVLLFTFIVRVNTVDGESMLPTLTGGQKLIVTDLFYTPSYNDIVIVQAPKLDGGKPIVKRIIGLPGDTIRIDFDNGIVYRNGTALPVEEKGGLIYEDGHTINDLTTRNLEMVSGQDYTVPEDSYFVMGDNRNNSKDSRLFSAIGFIDRKYIAGRAVFSVFPLNTFGFM